MKIELRNLAAASAIAAFICPFTAFSETPLPAPRDANEPQVQTEEQPAAGEAGDDSKSPLKRARKMRQGAGPGQPPGSTAGQPGNEDFDLQKFHKIKAFLDERFSPEELEQMKKLHRDNPEECREMLQKKLKQQKQDLDENDKQIGALVEKYRKTSDDKTKDELKAQVMKKLQEQFDRKMKTNLERIEYAEKKVKELRGKYEDRKARSDEILAERLRDIMLDPELKW